jgi:hypothetical protein
MGLPPRPAEVPTFVALPRLWPWTLAVPRTIPLPWLLSAVCVVGLVLSPVLAGFAPFGGDPELMYQPLKVELARALSTSRLPFWSDRFGLGVPLVAESHVAAFYPPNWLFYRLWDVATAYRLMMWIHWLALAAATYLYARALEISRAGSALAAISFSLCGFQAVHAPHEPFYHLMPYLPLCLYLADRYVVTGRMVYLAGLAIAWGVQLTLGHFQIQMWTGGLVLVTGGWRALSAAGAFPLRLGRIVGIFVGLAWGAAIAWVQLRLTWDLTGVAGFVRPPQFLANYLFPPAHWAQFVLPEVFLGRSSGVGDDYWGLHGTTPGEACAYVGIVPLILALAGWVALRRDRTLTPWRWIVPLSLALATMPGWWPDAFFLLLQLPGLGWFRAPARYTLMTSLGLALLAGRGLDLSIAPHRFWRGLTLAIIVGAAAWGWSIHYANGSAFQAGLGADTLVVRFVAAGLSWLMGLATIIAWRQKRVGAWAPILVTTLELGVLLFVGPVRWDWTIRLPEASPVLRQLAALPDVGLVGGRLLNLPVDAGQTSAYPYLGITPPPPNYLLQPATSPPGQNIEGELWQRRFGVTHGVWARSDDVRGTDVIAQVADPALDRLMSGVPSLSRSGLGPWKLVRNRGAFPAAWVSRRVREALNWGQLYTALTLSNDPDEAWFLAENSPPLLPAPAAHMANVQSWDSQTAVVEHDGPCILIMRRTYYPGWTYQVNGGPESPVLKVNAGLQGALLLGSGTSRVSVRYRPTGLEQAIIVTLTALAVAVLVLAVAGVKARVGSPRPR